MWPERCVWLLLMAVLVWPVSALQADENDKSVRDYQATLDKLYESIDKVQKHLKSTRSKRSSVVAELQKLESSISSNALKLKKTTAEISKLDSRIDKLRKQLRQLSIRVAQQRELLGEQLRAAYMSGSQQQLKILLNQQDPERLGRMQVYFDYLNRSRQQQISDYNTSIEAKRQTEGDLKSALTKQKGRLDEQQRQKKQLARQRSQRNQLLARLEREIEDQEVTLSDLRTSRDRIENLLESLGELLADIPPGPDGRESFATRVGDLPWPISGDFVARFGSSRKQGDLKWNGVLIAEHYGTPVRAVSHGRVVFSDWLQGFGFITILDHGNGYMTLYGHNESLFKQAGDWVEAGEVIATVGDSGGHPSPALYFEIRERGKPVDPARWCNSKVSHAL